MRIQDKGGVGACRGRDRTCTGWALAVFFWEWGLPLRPSVGDVRVDDMLQGRRGRAVFSKIVRNPTLPVDPLQPGSRWRRVTEEPCKRRRLVGMPRRRRALFRRRRGDRARRLLLRRRPSADGLDGGVLRVTRRAVPEALEEIGGERRLAPRQSSNVGRPRARVDARHQELGDGVPLVVVGHELGHGLRRLPRREARLPEELLEAVQRLAPPPRLRGRRPFQRGRQVSGQQRLEGGVGVRELGGPGAAQQRREARVVDRRQGVVVLVRCFFRLRRWRYQRLGAGARPHRSSGRHGPPKKIPVAGPSPGLQKLLFHLKQPRRGKLTPRRSVAVKWAETRRVGPRAADQADTPMRK
ncbi:unnamed protein product [Pelagomonas calceolata]|uniref:Uncharacterized protein n=1 Tax=Pelagomonas calceolata TaxID=35677 RepID=A0A8J2SMK4_9STRA|nr:unnamed protein product [Pelagomonas calceolata]